MAEIALAGSCWRLRGDPGLRPLLAGWSLDAELPWPAEQAIELGRNDGRMVVAIERSPTALSGARQAVCKWFAPRHRRSARREALLLRRCGERSAPAPRLLAVGDSRTGATLLLLEACTGVPLDEELQRCSVDERARLAARLGAELAALHRLGIVHRQLFAWHVLVNGQQTVLLDWAQARVGRRGARPLSDCARDLAALFSTLSRRALPLTARARLLREYEPDRPRRRKLAAAIRVARGPLLTRARLPRTIDLCERSAPTQRLLVAKDVVERWHGSANREPAPAIDAVESWLAPPRATVMRIRDGRANLRWDEPPGEPSSDPGGSAPSSWFGKRFETAPWRGRSFAFRDWVLLRALAASGLPMADCVAVGRRTGGASVIWTRGVRPGTTLREALPGLVREGPSRRALLLETAAIARRLHAAGFCHRDLYLDHLLLEARGESVGLVLIDVSRVEWFARLPWRARIKDLAALEFSGRDAGASRVERWRVLRAYLRGSALDARRVAMAAIAKADRIADHERRNGRPGPRG